MLSLSISSTGDEQVLQALADLERSIVDLRPIGAQVGEILLVDNMQARMLGVDIDNQPFADLAESTLRRRVGFGPPLAPMEMSSRVISGLEVEPVDRGPGALDVVGSWPDMPFLIYHVTGTRHMPRRDPVGIRPVAWATIGDAFDAWVDGLLTQRY